MEIKSRIWVEIDGKPFLGNGRIALLKEIIDSKSISSASKKMGMSYKKACKIIKEMETLTEKPILIKTIGGVTGGGTIVTEYGKLLITQFEDLKKKQNQFFENQKINSK